MTIRSVSKNYSSFNPVVLRKKERLKKASNIISVIKRELNSKEYGKLNVLDVGCSSGVITNELAKNFSQVLGIDVDSKAVANAKKDYLRNNLKFETKNAIKTGFKKNNFDLIVANQVYYCFKKPEDFFKEMYRILKPGGIMFLGARNKHTFWDAQYHLPLLSFMPRSLATLMVKNFGRSNKFDVEYRSYWQLKKITKQFLIKTYSSVVIKRYSVLLKFVPNIFFNLLEPIFPNFIWILKKPKVY